MLEIERLAAHTVDPRAAAAGMERLWSAAPAALRSRLEQDAGLTQALMTVMASSEFLAEALVQSPELALWLGEERRRPAARARESWSLA
ncbi:MAG: hypothetical protein ACRD1E_12280, partial [Terriglobales bacterium]